jgi:hypothetical protein
LADPAEQRARLRQTRRRAGFWPGGWVWPFPRTTNWASFPEPVTGRAVLHRVVLEVGELEAVARNAGMTVYQMCLAALAGALRAWRPLAFDQSGRSRNRNGLRAFFLVNLRLNDHDALGNGASVMPVILPCGEPSPTKWLQGIAMQTDRRRIERYRRMLASFTRVFPYWLLVRTNVGLRPLVVSTMRLSDGLTVFGAPVTEATGHPGHPFDVHLAVMMQRYTRNIVASVMIDESVAEPQRLGVVWRQAVSQLNQAT